MGGAGPTDPLGSRGERVVALVRFALQRVSVASSTRPVDLGEVPARMNRSTRILLAVLALVALGAAACGDDDDDTGGGATATSAAPEDLRATDDVVAAGLQQIDGLVQQASAVVGSDKAAAQALSDQIEPVWQKVEGTVKANDQEIYLTFEDSFAALAGAAEKADTARAAKAAADVKQAVATYLAAHPA
jgi:hypothetical protein